MNATIKYSDFGAVGDGVTNDFYAIKKAHEYANEISATVVADEEKTYLISETNGEYISIKTDTDWRGAKFIIDDSVIAPRTKEAKESVIKIESDYECASLSAEEIRELNSKNKITAKHKEPINLGLGYPVMAVFENSGHYNYIRWGGDANNGSAQRELVLFDSFGNIDEDTPFLYDYDSVTGVSLIRTDVKPITITGGHFTFIACDTPVTYCTYIARNISLQRSNTVIDGLSCCIVGELEDAQYPSYVGQIDISNSNNVLIKNCIFSARKYYKLCGTYGICMTMSNNVTFKNCKQHNFYIEGLHSPSICHGYWGIMGSNYCKNIVYDECELTRFDAHCGLYNGKIINSRVAAIEIIGGGNMLIENSTIHCNGTIIQTRGDYGCTWNGTVTLRNVHIINTGEIYLLTSYWVNHYFGYKTYMPNLIIDNVTLEKPMDIRIISKNGRVETSLCYNPHAHLEMLPDGKKNENPYAPPSEITAINQSENFRVTLYDIPLFEKTKITGVEKIPL